MPRNEALITPTVLSWARQEAGYTEEAFALKIKVKPETYRLWETGAARPTFKQFIKIADTLKRPLSVFYAQMPPDEPSVSAELRGISYEPVIIDPSTKLIQAYRRVQHYRSIIIELFDGLEQAPPLFATDLNPRDMRAEVLATKVRAILGTSIDEQSRCDTVSAAFTLWRSRLEEHGILVFQIHDVDILEMRGFAIYQEVLPIIAVNSKDSFSARIFTVFHELGHILRKNSVLHNSANFIQDTAEMALFCNSFAASLLVPMDDLRDRLARLNGSALTATDITSLAKFYKVSPSVMVRRCFDAGFLGADAFAQLRQEFDLFIAPPSNKQPGGTAYLNSISRIGRLLPKLAFENYAKDNITLSTLSGIVGFKVENLPKFQQHVFS